MTLRQHIPKLWKVWEPLKAISLVRQLWKVCFFHQKTFLESQNIWLCWNEMERQKDRSKTFDVKCAQSEVTSPLYQHKTREVRMRKAGLFIWTGGWVALQFVTAFQVQLYQWESEGCSSFFTVSLGGSLTLNKISVFTTQEMNWKLMRECQVWNMEKHKKLLLQLFPDWKTEISDTAKSDPLFAYNYFRPQ